MSTTPFMARRLVTGRAIGRRIAQLDPVADNEEATHLSVEVRYGDAIFAHAAYTVAFARQVAVPSIARIVYRTGTGDMMADVRRRNNDTLLFFGEMLRHGHSSPEGRAVIDRMEQIHARFGITAEDKLYTLGSLAFEADRIVDHLGLDVFTENERTSRYHFWRGVGTYMGLEVPGTRTDFLDWTLAYESAYAATAGGRALVDQLFSDWRQRWFPARAHRWADDILLTLFPDDLRAVHGLPAPPQTLRTMMPRLVGAYLGWQAVRPHRPQRSWSDHFGADHSRPLQVSTLGHRPRPTAAKGQAR
ncbi:hypothetical protein [Nocardia sp. NPDC050718]|uniref:hypothetical protein n=1 Tax=Nocardia sp. NPDC050718 TaxID=3155788 RepID=UPI0033D6FA10